MMKKEPHMLCAICHDVIRTRHVFAEKNQVYLKKEQKKESISENFEEIWSPINFQWIADLETRNTLIHYSNT